MKAALRMMMAMGDNCPQCNAISTGKSGLKSASLNVNRAKKKFSTETGFESGKTAVIRKKLSSIHHQTRYKGR